MDSCDSTGRSTMYGAINVIAKVRLSMEID